MKKKNQEYFCPTPDLFLHESEVISEIFSNVSTIINIYFDFPIKSSKCLQILCLSLVCSEVCGNVLPVSGSV